MQHNLVFGGATALEDKGAVHVSVGSHNEAHAHIQVVLLNMEQRVGGE